MAELARAGSPLKSSVKLMLPQGDAGGDKKPKGSPLKSSVKLQIGTPTVKKTEPTRANKPDIGSKMKVDDAISSALSGSLPYIAKQKEEMQVLPTDFSKVTPVGTNDNILDINPDFKTVVSKEPIKQDEVSSLQKLFNEHDLKKEQERELEDVGGMDYLKFLSQTSVNPDVMNPLNQKIANEMVLPLYEQAMKIKNVNQLKDEGLSNLPGNILGNFANTGSLLGGLLSTPFTGADALLKSNKYTRPISTALGVPFEIAGGLGELPVKMAIDVVKSLGVAVRPETEQAITEFASMVGQFLIPAKVMKSLKIDLHGKTPVEQSQILKKTIIELKNDKTLSPEQQRQMTGEDITTPISETFDQPTDRVTGLSKVSETGELKKLYEPESVKTNDLIKEKIPFIDQATKSAKPVVEKPVKVTKPKKEKVVTVEKPVTEIPVEKPLWQMTANEVLAEKRGNRSDWRKAVKGAIDKGEELPQKVVDELHPDIRKDYEAKQENLKRTKKWIAEEEAVKEKPQRDVKADRVQILNDKLERLQPLKTGKNSIITSYETELAKAKKRKDKDTVEYYTDKIKDETIKLEERRKNSAPEVVKQQITDLKKVDKMMVDAIKVEDVPLKEQKTDIVSQVEGAIETVVGKDNMAEFERLKKEKTFGNRAINEYLDARDDHKGTIKKLRDAGYKVEDGGKVSFHIKGDGTYGIHIETLDMILDKIKKEFPTNYDPKTRPLMKDNVSRTKDSPYTLAESLKNTKEITFEIEQAKENLKNAGQIGKPKLADMFKKEVDFLEEAKSIYEANKKKVKDAVNSPNINMMGLGKLADITKPEVLKAVYEIAKHHVSNGIKNFGEFTRRMIKDVGAWVKPHLRKLWSEVKDWATTEHAYTGSKGLGESFNLNLQAPKDVKTMLPQGKKMRKSSERMSKTDKFSEKNLEERPESYYDQQTIKTEQQKVADMLPDERMAKFNETEKLAKIQDAGDNNSILAGISLLEEALASGDTKKFDHVYETLVKAGTSMGQMIRQFGELKTNTAKGIVEIVKKKAKDEKVKINPVLEKVVGKTAEDFLRENAILKELIKKLKKDGNPTEQKIKEAVEQKKKTDKAHTKLAETMNRAVPMSIDDVLIQIMQGNTLTPGSLVTNLFGNLALLPVRIGTKLVSNAADLIVSKVTGKPRTSHLGWGAYFGSFGKGFFTRTPGHLENLTANKYEVAQGLHPLRAWGEILRGDTPVKENGQVHMTGTISKVLEAVLGVPPAIFFKALEVVDRRFYNAYTRAGAYEQARLKGLKGDQLKAEMLFPEQSKAIKEDGLAGIYADDNMVVNGLMLGAKHITGKVPKPVAGLMNMIARPNLLYMKIPLNIASEILDYSLPPLTISKAAYHFSKGNMKAGYMYLGKAVTGSIMWGTAQYMVDNDLVTGSYETNPKKRGLDYETKKPYSLNVSALRRSIENDVKAFLGSSERESTEWKKGDEIVNYQKSGVIGGIIMLASDYKERKAEGEDFLNNTIALGMGVPQFALEQSVMTGVKSLVNVFTDKEGERGALDKWIDNYTKLVANIPLPNTINTVSKVYQDYIMEAKEYNNIDLIAKEKFGGYNAFKRNIWGQKIPVAPFESKTEKLIYLLSPLKGEGFAPDENSMMIGELFNETQDTDVIPSTPKETFLVDKKKITLKRDQYEEFLELTGKYRLKEIDNVKWDGMDTEKKVEKLKKIYEKTRDKAKGEILGKYKLK